MREYMDRGDALRDWNYLDFFLGTYDGKLLKEGSSPRGRKPNMRVPYKAGRNRDKRCRIIRTAGHETMPYFPGQWFPKREGEGSLFYQASMLALFKPWYSTKDLKQEDESWGDAFDSFFSRTTESVKKMMENIQFYHECSEGARARQTNDDVSSDAPVGTEDVANEEGDVPLVDSDRKGGGDEQFAQIITEEDVQRLMEHPFSTCEERYAEQALSVGFDSGALDCPPFETVYRKPAYRATDDVINLFPMWENALRNSHDNKEQEMSSNGEVMAADDIAHTSRNQLTEAAYLRSSLNETVDKFASSSLLNDRQKMAFDIVISQLQAHMRNEPTPQQLMIVYGQGGTGKTAMLNAISKAFADYGASHLLAKTAYSGVAASLIGGQTLHTWGALPVRGSTSTKWITHPGKEVNLRRKRNFAVSWLFIDEMSMLTTPLLDNLSQATGFVRTGVHSTEPSTAFGGLNVMLLGDFHQLPPVANSKRALYHSSPPDDSSGYGRAYYEQFNIVVKLEEQMRIVDVEWDSILKRARTGDCTQQDIQEIRKLVLTNEECKVPDFSTEPWNDAVLVTPRNGSRVYWNMRKVEQHCRANGHTHYVFYARDNTKQRLLTLQERLVIASLKTEETNNLPNKVDFAIGMKVMVLMNIDTDSDLANESRGVISGIILDPRENVEDAVSSKVVLMYPPAAIIFTPLYGGKKNVPGLPPGTIPIFPSRRSFTLKAETNLVIDREQYALTPAYAFTDYKAQGQTMECVIIDLGKPPSGKLTGFNMYVALSRGRGRATIRLLRDFEDKLFTTHPSEELRKEDERLDLLAQSTIRRWREGEL